MKSSFTLITLGLFLITTACKNEVKQEAEVVTVPTKSDSFNHEGEAISVTFKDPNLNALFVEYIDLKNALVNTDAAKTSGFASNLMEVLNKMEDNEVALRATQNIVETDNVEEQRSSFVIVTAEVEKYVSNAEITSGALYKQYCPMAFNNEGAFWLSETNTVANPYFGDKMYRCGRVDSKIE